MSALFEAHYCSPVFVTLTFQTVHWQLLATPQYGSRLSRRGCASGFTSGSWSPRPSSPIASSTSEPRRFSRKKNQKSQFSFCTNFAALYHLHVCLPVYRLRHPSSHYKCSSKFNFKLKFCQKVPENQVGKAKSREFRVE